MFLTTDELKTVSTVAVVNLITNNQTEIVDEVIEENIDLMKSYLFKYYDTEAIFAAAGDERSKIVLKHLKTLVIFDLYQIRRKDITPEMEMKWDRAMEWLTKISKGDIEADLPRKQVDTDGDGTPDANSTFMKLGSRKNYKNHW
ncbi:MAG: phage protein Gp36 family protein [Christiangramia sp.]|uniref:phage protein Gp36 family protein n=1 Tax=Christiangramia sp. TaxID=1931228 RepID=UPI003242EF3C